MQIFVSSTTEETGRAAALRGAGLIRASIAQKGECTIVVATGASQIDMLKELVKADVDWSRVTAFHLDEYIGITASHPASFRKYLKERFVDLVPLKKLHYIDGETDVLNECKRLSELIRDHIVDVAFIGIGENGHLAFNDPPADLETRESFIEVELDHDCRMQQLGERWFNHMDEVPDRAISMSISRILESVSIICTVPEGRKAVAVRNAVEKEISPGNPASVLQTHPRTWLYLDMDSASLLGQQNR